MNTAPITRFTGTYRFLSNFSDSEIIGPRDLPCRTVEHAFQAAKAMLYLDAQRISEQLSPGAAKRAGGKGQLIMIRPDWDEVKLGFMKLYLHRKFAIPVLQRLLLDTGDRHLEEGNDHGDRYWGTVGGEGKNHLGLLLMEVRDEIRRGIVETPM